MFKNHPQIHAQGEILVGADADRQRRKTLQALQPADAEEKNIKAAGFKCKFRDIADFDSFRTALHEVDAKIIYLYRENTVKRVVSLLNAIRLEEATGWWNLHKEKNRPGPFEIDPVDFDERLRRMTASKIETEERAKSLGLPTLTFKYEDILKDVEDVRSQVFSFLGVDHIEVDGSPLKTTSDDLRDVIINFEDLRSRYLGTEFAWMFSEVLVSSQE